MTSQPYIQLMGADGDNGHFFFKKMMVHIHDLHIQYHLQDFLIPNPTLRRNFLWSFGLFSLYPKELADMSANCADMTIGQSGCHILITSDQTFANILPTCRHFLLTSHLKGLGNMARCQHFQLSSSMSWCVVSIHHWYSMWCIFGSCIFEPSRSKISCVLLLFDNRKVFQSYFK